MHHSDNKIAFGYWPLAIGFLAVSANLPTVVRLRSLRRLVIFTLNSLNSLTSLNSLFCVSRVGLPKAS